MVNEELLAEAKLRFPIGTKFYPAHLNGHSSDNKYCIIVDHNFTIDYNTINSRLPNGKLWDYDWDTSTKYGNCSLNRYLYYGGKWATVLSTPTPKEIEIILY